MTQIPDKKPQNPLDDLCADLKPVTPLPSPLQRFGLWLIASLVCQGIGLAWFGIRSDLAFSWNDPWFLIEALATLLLGVLATAGAFLLSVPGQETNVRTKWVSLVPILLWFTVLLLRSLSQGDSWRPIYGIGHCAGDILALAFIPGLLIFYMLRKAAPLRLEWSGALACFGAAGIAAGSIQLSCNWSHPLHLLSSHFFPVVLLGVLGLWLGRQLLPKL